MMDDYHSLLPKILWNFITDVKARVTVAGKD